MRAAFHAALSKEPAEVQDRVTLQDGRIGELAAVTGDRLYDLVLLLGVLMYLPASQRDRHSRSLSSLTSSCADPAPTDRVFERERV